MSRPAVVVIKSSGHCKLVKKGHAGRSFLPGLTAIGGKLFTILSETCHSVFLPVRATIASYGGEQFFRQFMNLSRAISLMVYVA